jgi:hypothetical protein
MPLNPMPAGYGLLMPCRNLPEWLGPLGLPACVTGPYDHDAAKDEVVWLAADVACVLPGEAQSLRRGPPRGCLAGTVSARPEVA